MTSSSFAASVRPELLRWARQTSGFTVEHLAKAAGVQPSTWDAWENGQAHPTFRQLERVAKRCRRPVALFYLPEPPREESAPEDFRRLPGATPAEFAPETLVNFRRARRLQSVAIEMLGLGRPEADRWFPRFHLDDDQELAGGLLRTLLSVTVDTQRSWVDDAEAYRRWRLATERVGILVFQFRMPLENARGFSLWNDRLPVLVVNSADPLSARCFTLFHEMAHLTLRTPGVCLVEPRPSPEANGRQTTVERFCNAVAAAVLLPLVDEWVGQALDRAAAAPAGIEREAATLKVSREVMLWRMVETGRIHREAARQIAANWTARYSEAAPPKKPPGGPALTVRRLAERGISFSAAVLDALDEGRITYPDVSEFLELSTTQLEAFRQTLSDRLQKAGVDE